VDADDPRRLFREHVRQLRRAPQQAHLLLLVRRMPRQRHVKLAELPPVPRLDQQVLQQVEGRFVRRIEADGALQVGLGPLRVLQRPVLELRRMEQQLRLLRPRHPPDHPRLAGLLVGGSQLHQPVIPQRRFMELLPEIRRQLALAHRLDHRRQHEELILQRRLEDATQLLDGERLRRLGLGRHDGRGGLAYKPSASTGSLPTTSPQK
jgi:hypothetical protein